MLYEFDVTFFRSTWPRSNRCRYVLLRWNRTAIMSSMGLRSTRSRPWRHDHDGTVNICWSVYTLHCQVDVLREQCAIETSHRPHVPLWHCSEENTILGDAHICGFVNKPTRDGQRTVMTPEFDRAVSLFPFLRPHTAAMMIIAVRCGVGRPAIALAALEAIQDRVSHTVT